MMKRVWFFAPLLVAGLMAGCGGGGGSALPSPFAGSWTDNQGSTVSVDSKGHVLGTGTYTLADGTQGNGTWQGAVGNDGTLSGTFTNTANGQSTSAPVSGESTIGSDSHWRGTLVLTYQGKTASTAFDMVKQ